MSNHKLYCGCSEKNCTAMWRFRFGREYPIGFLGSSSQLDPWEINDASVIVVHMLCANPSSELRNRNYAGTPFYLSCNCGEVDFRRPPRGHKKECAVSVVWKVHEVRQRLDQAARSNEIPVVYGRYSVKTVAQFIPIDLTSLPTMLESELVARIAEQIDHEMLYGTGTLHGSIKVK